MKNIKSYIVGIAALGALAFTGCNTDVDPVGVKIPEASLTPNTTLLELKTEFWDDATNYIKTIETKENGDHYIIHGRVVSNDDAGNIFKSLVIQDETCALAFSINTYDLYVNYRVGQEIVVDATGMQIGKYNGLQQMGKAEWYENGQVWEASFMPLEVFRSHVELNGLPDVSKVDTIQINTFSELPSDAEGLRKFQSQLVKFNNIKFQEGGKEKFSEYQSSGVNRLIEDSEGATLNVRTSGYSDFWNMTLPEGNGDLVCILGYYGTTGWQLNLIDYAGCMNFGNPTIAPGGKDNPYTVEEAIAVEANGKKASGWVTGYIVGTVAPEVVEISSSNDIEWTAEASLANTLVIGPTADCKDIAKCLVMALPQDSKLRQYAALRDNPEVYQRQIWVYGTLDSFMGNYGITGNKGGVDQFRIDGVEVDGGASGAGDGSKENPYNVTQVQGGVTGTAWVTGYIVGTVTDKSIQSDSEFGTANANAANILIALTPEVNDYTQCVPVQLVSGSDPRKALNLKDHPENLGKSVKIYGSIEKYFGVAGVKSVTEYVLGEGGGDTPVVPGDDAAPAGDGTAASPYNCSRALELAQALSDTETLEGKYVTGVITAIKEVSTQYGNATYTIGDEGYTSTFSVYRGYYIDGAKFTAEDQIKVGDKVVVKGNLVNFKGNTPQLTQGSQIVSINGSTEGGGTEPGPGTDPDPDEPNPPVQGGDVTILATALTNVPGATTIDGYTIDIQKGPGTTNPTLHANTSAIRTYAKNTIEVKGARMTKIVFTLAKDAGYRYTELKASTGTVSPQATGDTSITWEGDASSVTFTVGDNATMGSDGASKAGQIRFTQIDITAAK